MHYEEWKRFPVVCFGNSHKHALELMHICVGAQYSKCVNSLSLSLSLSIYIYIYVIYTYIYREREREIYIYVEIYIIVPLKGEGWM